MIEYVKLIYEIRYPKILNFKDLYKGIINPYFVYPNAKYAILNEGTHTESIRMTFPDSNYYLLFTYDRISFQYDGSFEELKKSGSHLEMCFEIFNKIKKVTTFYKTTTESIEIIALKQIDKENDNIIKEFNERYSVKNPFKNVTDTAVIIEGNENNNVIRVQYGPFSGEKEVEALLLYSLNEELKLQLLEKEGIIIQCNVKREADTATKGSYRELLLFGNKVILNILNEHE